MLGAFLSSSEKRVIPSVFMFICPAVRREKLGFHAADVHGRAYVVEILLKPVDKLKSH
jgi:hypothetical protein